MVPPYLEQLTSFLRVARLVDLSVPADLISRLEEDPAFHYGLEEELSSLFRPTLRIGSRAGDAAYRALDKLQNGIREARKSNERDELRRLQRIIHEASLLVPDLRRCGIEAYFDRLKAGSPIVTGALVVTSLYWGHFNLATLNEVEDFSGGGGQIRLLSALSAVLGEPISPYKLPQGIGAQKRRELHWRPFYVPWPLAYYLNGQIQWREVRKREELQLLANRYLPGKEGRMKSLRDAMLA